MHASKSKYTTILRHITVFLKCIKQFSFHAIVGHAHLYDLGIAWIFVTLWGERQSLSISFYLAQGKRP